MRAALGPGGVILDGTCDEWGRRAAWVALDADGPLTLTFATRVSDIDTPSDLAERLPKALIHHNVPGQPVHEFLRAFDAAWAAAAGLSTFGPRQRWVAAVEALAGSGVAAGRLDPTVAARRGHCALVCGRPDLSTLSAPGCRAIHNRPLCPQVYLAWSERSPTHYARSCVRTEAAQGAGRLTAAEQQLRVLVDEVFEGRVRVLRVGPPTGVANRLLGPAGGTTTSGSQG